METFWQLLVEIFEIDKALLITFRVKAAFEKDL